MRIKTLALTIGLVAAASLPAAAKDYLVTMAKPGNLYVIDAAARSVTKDCKLDFNVSPAIITMSPDGKIAYVLANRWGTVYGIDIDSCETVFTAEHSYDNVRARVIGSIAVSKDGKELYTVRNPVKILSDRYQVMEPEFLVFDTSAGLDAKPIRTFPAPRRLTLLATDKQGKVYAAGHDIIEFDPQTGAQSVKIPNANWERPTYSPPDVLAFWPVGSQNDEFMLLYTAVKFTDEKREEIADYVWGYESINLTSGESKIADFASLEVIMFSAVRNPKAPNELYGVYSQLSKHDVDSNKLIKRVDLPHTYYVINISTDGKEVYVGGTNDDIGVYDSETLEKIGEIRLPSGGDMGTATVQVVQR